MGAVEGISAVIADVSAVGGYFHLDVGEAPDGSWSDLGALFADGEAFAAKVAAAADRLGTAEPRVAASVLHLGIVSRLWSPVLGALVVHRVLLDWTAEGLQFEGSRGGPLPLRLPSPSGRRVGDPVRAAPDLYAAVSPLLESLAGLVLGEVRLSRRLLWGNAASALGGAVLALASARPSYAVEALALGEALLGFGGLRSAGAFTEPVPGRVSFARTSCCLYYRAPAAGKCGDCVLRKEP